MSTRFTRYFLTTAIALSLSPAAFAQGKGDSRSVDGKLSLAKLFTDAASPATAATVRVRCNSKDAALGLVVDANGYILTKGSELRGAISVLLRDGSEHDATYIGYHEPTDLALVKIDQDDVKLATVTFASGKLANPADFVAAPGTQSEPVAAGVVGAGVRKLFGEEARIQNGNKGYLGIIINTTLPGVIIGEINDNSPARKAKLKVNDAIVKIAGKDVKAFEDMAKILDDYRPGDKVKVKILRKNDDEDDDELEFDVVLGDRGRFDQGALQNKMGSALSGRRTGFPQVIMHDMVLKPADCGGALVNIEGKVLGVNIARAGRVETWALPAEVVTPVIAELKAGKYPLKKKDVAAKADGKKPDETAKPATDDKKTTEQKKPTKEKD